MFASSFHGAQPGLGGHHFSWQLTGFQKLLYILTFCSLPRKTPKVTGIRVSPFDGKYPKPHFQQNSHDIRKWNRSFFPKEIIHKEEKKKG